MSEVSKSIHNSNHSLGATAKVAGHCLSAHWLEWVKCRAKILSMGYCHFNFHNYSKTAVSKTTMWVCWAKYLVTASRLILKFFNQNIMSAKTRWNFNSTSIRFRFTKWPSVWGLHFSLVRHLTSVNFIWDALEKMTSCISIGEETGLFFCLVSVHFYHVNIKALIS